MNVNVPGINQLLIVVLASLGWPLMVTGQSLVLYSRLHMLFIERRTLRLVLAMIIFNALAIHSTGISLSIGLQFHRKQLILAYRSAIPWALCRLQLGFPVSMDGAPPSNGRTTWFG